MLSLEVVTKDEDVVDSLELRAGRATAVVVPQVGGRVASLRVDGRRLLREVDDGAALDWARWGAYPMVPWSNRIPGGRLRWDGQDHRVPVNFEDGTAIHGLTADVAWQVEQAETDRVVLTRAVRRAPWRLTVTSVIDLGPNALAWRLAVRNDGAAPVPVGLGIHPWFPAGDLRVPADEVWPAGEDCLPTGAPVPVEDAVDLRGGGAPPSVDRCYTDLTGTELVVGDTTMSWDGPVTHVVVCTLDPDWYAIEPVTNATDGFGLLARGADGHGVIVLAPGEETAVTTTLSW